MRIRTFSKEEKEDIRRKMMTAGVQLLKENGMTHMSISKLTDAVGIGKSTFYSFYKTKEEFVEALLSYHRKRLIGKLQTGLHGKEKYTKEEGIQLLRGLIQNTGELYQHFSQEDELALKRMYEKNGTPYLDLNREIQTIQHICSMVEGVRKDLDYAVISNLVKLTVFASEHREMLHESGYDRTIQSLVDVLIQNLFE